MNKSNILVLALSLLALLGGIFFLMEKAQLKSQQPIPKEVLALWNEWKINNTRIYGAEEQSRIAIFYENYKKVLQHNSNSSRTYDLGFTPFMDLTQEEFVDQYLTATIPLDEQSEPVYLNTLDLPDSIDWTKKGAVGPVKNQKQCGSCWAFSTTAALEGAYAVAGKGLLSFSEQQLVDCSGSYGNQGCNGGWPRSAFKYIQDHGINLEDNYPYTARDGQCKKSSGPYQVKGFTSVPKNDVNQLAAAVNIKPVSVCLDANNFNLYKGGVFDNCGHNVDHCVLLVGYTPSYWIIKNSWGKNWGESGYIRLARGNTCSVASSPTYAKV